eukprot:scaffold12306_cov71-Phaeocystis_antarctica.AAC.3
MEHIRNVLIELDEHIRNVVSVDAREARAGVDRRSCVRRVELVSHQVGKPAEPGGACYEARHEQPPHTDD